MSFNIEHFTLRTLTPKLIVARCEHSNRMQAEEMPDEPPADPSEALQRLRAMPATARQHVWVHWHRGRIAASAMLGWAELDSNRHRSFVWVGVEPEVRRRGLASRLLALAVTEALRVRRPILTSFTTDRVPAGRYFVRLLGLRKGLEAHVNQLALDRLDRGLTARWIAAARERAGAYAIELWDGPVPEADLAAFARLNDVMNSAPHDNLDIEDVKVTPRMIRDGEAWLFANGSRRLIACARHRPTGDLAGFTALTWHPKRPAIVSQGDTGVVAQHRDRGLGRWLKAFNIEALLAANPEARVVRTGNADSNAPMLAINQQMGFAPLIANTVWQGRAPAIARRLQLRGLGEERARSQGATWNTRRVA